MASYLPRIERYARSFNGVGGAEFDDLVQEGSLKVFVLLRDEQPVSNTAIKNAMRDWVRYCRRKGFSIPLVEEAIDYYASAAPGTRAYYYTDDDATPQGGRGHFADPS